MTNQILQCLLLQRSIDGRNSVENINLTLTELLSSKTENGTEIESFVDFLSKVKADHYEILIELAQVLKVPFNDLIQLKEASEKKEGYLTKKSKENILAYFNTRMSPRMLDFLSCQEGKAGFRNSPKV